MPGRSGYDIASSLRTRPGGDALEIVAVTGWDGYTSKPMWASNRNFDAQNDTVFFLTRADSAVGGTHSYDIHVVRASQPYGLPPNGRQPSTPATDPTKGMQTNDGRWLGAQEMPDGSVHRHDVTGPQGAAFGAENAPAGVDASASTPAKVHCTGVAVSSNHTPTPLLPAGKATSTRGLVPELRRRCAATGPCW